MTTTECGNCGTVVQRFETGRPRRFCSTRCRQANWRFRRATKGRSESRVPIETWWLPRPSTSLYPGSFPLHFESKLMKLLGGGSLLQPFAGKASLGTRMDINADLNPDVVGDAHDLPFAANSFDVALLDPPYSDKESADIYGTGPINLARCIAEAVRVSRRYVATYHSRMLPRPEGTSYERIIVVLLRANHAPRVCQVWKVMGSEVGRGELDRLAR